MGRGRGTIALSRRRFIVLLCAVAFGIGSLVGCDDEDRELERLRALNNHAKHVALNMDCMGCHTGARDEDYAGLPSVGQCARCHKLDRDFPPTPPELAEYIKSGTEIPWVRVNRVPGHVYFSHVAHVKFGQIECGECHGDMRDPVHPVERPLVRPADMFACIECHRQRQASVDCLTCHK
ncbi:MAG: cytochrome c3 family protein [Pirellulaceae bacterium]